MVSMSCLEDLFTLGKTDNPAIRASNSKYLTYFELRKLIIQTRNDLHSLDIYPTDRIAIVLPNGPLMATAFIAIACYATAAPLNPSYLQDEFEFFMSDLGVKALVVEYGSSSPAIEAAKKIGTKIITLDSPQLSGAGYFRISGAQASDSSFDISYNENNIALVLHTSGTTSRPKIVPLSHKNIWSSIQSIAQTLEFSENDCGLNIMPLFHIHGLMAGLLAPLSRGGSVYCSSGFNALKFFSWMDEANPTWYTAVPTMHQAILLRANKNKNIIEQNPLRFIRSSSSPLSPQVLTELEAIFNSLVIESYGMTEASHQIASNPLKGIRKPGTVGIAAGPKIAIMDEKGNIKKNSEIGEIVIKGDNITMGYENNPKANQQSFTNGWFRTGDQGFIDNDGYISITGRLKEIINRGGEKISPREIDETLMDHPDVQQVVTFSIPHPILGEDVAAAVVLCNASKVTDQELREFISKRLALFKVPKKIIFMEEIPKGPTGKIQRISLAKTLGLVD